MDFGDLAKEFWDKGLILVPGLFKQDEMAALNRTIEDHFGVEPDYSHKDEFIVKSQSEIVPWFPQREGNTEFDFVESNEILDALTQAILGTGWIGQYCMVMFSKKGTAGQAWHQDCPPENQFFNLNRLIYTSDIRPEIGGAVVVMPESHRWGELPAGEPHDDLPGQVVLTPKQGDLLFLHVNGGGKLGQWGGVKRGQV